VEANKLKDAKRTICARRSFFDASQAAEENIGVIRNRLRRRKRGTAECKFQG